MTVILTDNPVATTSTGLFPRSFSMRMGANIRREGWVRNFKLVIGHLAPIPLSKGLAYT